MQAMLQNQMQQEVFRAKLLNFHINALIQGEKSIIYEDVNVKVGSVRKLVTKAKVLGVKFKIFVRNHNQQQSPITTLGIAAVPVKVPNTVMQVTRSSSPLPIQPPNPPLMHNQTVDLDVDVSFDGDPAKNGGFRAFGHGLYQVAFHYEIQNLKKLGTLQIILPLNILHLLSPLSMIKANDFKGMWTQIKARQNCPPNCQSVAKSFTLDLQKAQNMHKLKQIVGLNEDNGFHIVADVDPSMPNVVYFAAQLRRPELMPG